MKRPVRKNGSKETLAWSHKVSGKVLGGVFPCPMCERPVRVYSGDEGTNSYEAVEEKRPGRVSVEAWALFTPQGKLVETGQHGIPWIARNKEAFYPWHKMARRVLVTEQCRGRRRK